MENLEYNAWRRDISCEWVLRTGKSFPRRNTSKWEDLCAWFVRMSDWIVTPDPSQVVDMMENMGV
jgi:hypothetical protein